MRKTLVVYHVTVGHYRTSSLHTLLMAFFLASFGPYLGSKTRRRASWLDVL